ncbi:hypothetical protein H5410_039685 [Solanum commersonii]|uniref:Peptidase A1 domain-containing protein n=1 Tax=Solanum commersonii TaxID=4109 RepID=A0A9J5XLM7_SOLCO|nr:hypothetical protein H5410_039685 [Solanum commersonii]
MEIDTKAFTLIPMLVLLSFFHLSLVSCHNNVNGFTLDLIHHDSPLSPYHNPSNTPFERLQNAFYRSSSRASFFKKKSHVNSIQSTITATDGEYLMKISIGTPPIDIFAFADTGSDLTWTQCGGKTSIVNQINQEIKGKFSYCLIPFESSLTNSSITSHINFGDTVVVSGPGVVSTPLIRIQTFYTLSLESISIGNKTLPFKSSNFSSIPPQGNIIIDSGTTLTLVPVDFYAELEKTLVDSINATRKLDPSKSYRLCYTSENGTIDVPKIVVHFTNADLELPPTNTFVQVAEGLVCFTMVPDEEVSILGNLAQMNFLIGFDLVANKVSFLPTDCTKH